MNRLVLGAVGALLMVASGLFWLQGRAELARGVPPPDISASPAPPDALPQAPIVLPSANPGARGSRLPRVAVSRETQAQRRFNRYDRNRDGRITREEMLSTRVKAFQKLDTNHDNMLSFEEWAVKTSDRFREIDRNHDGVITPDELAAYYAARDAKKIARPLACACSRPARDADAGSDGDPLDPPP